MPGVSPLLKVPPYFSRESGFFVDTIEDTATYDAFPSGAVAANGHVLVVARRGTSHTSGDGDIVLWSSTDDGETWSASSVIFDHTTEGFDLRDPGLVKLSNETLLLTMHLGSTGGANITDGCAWATSTDNGATWSSLNVLSDAFAGFSAQCARVLELANSDLLWVIYGNDSSPSTTNDWYSKVYKSTDGASTWSYLSAIGSSADAQPWAEPSLFLSGSTIVATVRHDSEYALYRATSTDSGATWSSLASVLTYVRGASQGVRLPNGSLVVCLPTYASAAGTDLGGFIYRSTDSGASWTQSYFVTGLPMQYAAPFQDGATVLVPFSVQQSTSDADIAIARVVGR